MGKIKTVELTRAQRAALEKDHRTGASHAFRMRSRMILLKSESRTAAEIADLLGCREVVVNNWLKRYESEGIEGLRTRPGRGRKPVLDAENDLPKSHASASGGRGELENTVLRVQSWFKLILFGYYFQYR